MSYFLKKPYTDTEYADFIVLHNHNNRRRIEETETALYALEPWEIFINGEVIDNTEAYEAEQFALAKESKYKEANEGAKEYLESGSALYALELPSLPDENHTPETYHIEATDGNIGKLAAYALAFISGQLGAEERMRLPSSQGSSGRKTLCTGTLKRTLLLRSTVRSLRRHSQDSEQFRRRSGM